MSLALGRSRSDEYRPGLRKIARCLQGQTGLLFTNASEQQVLRYIFIFFNFFYLRIAHRANAIYRQFDSLYLFVSSQLVIME